MLEQHGKPININSGPLVPNQGVRKDLQDEMVRLVRKHKKMYSSNICIFLIVILFCFNIVWFYLFRPLKVIQRKKHSMNCSQNHKHACDEGSLVDTGLLWMSSCETHNPWLRELYPQDHFEKSWVVRGNGLPSLNNYHQDTLTLSLCLNPPQRCPCVQQSTSQRNNVYWKHLWNINYKSTLKLPVVRWGIDQKN